MDNKAGFTLIEVLVALAIISIALTAILKITSQTIKNTFYLQEKTIALWVAENTINEIRAGIIKAPLAPDLLKEEKEALNQQWSYSASLKNTPNVHIKEISVDVYMTQQHMRLAHLESYLYEP